MNSSKYPMYSYVPVKPNQTKFYDLDKRLKEMTFNEVMNNPKKHFDNVYVTNFDLIHYNCRGDRLQHSEKFYKTIYSDQLEKLNSYQKSEFVSAGIKSERKDVYFEKRVLMQHFDIELKLIEQNVFLSSMKKEPF